MNRILIKNQFEQLADADQQAAIEFADRIREQLDEPVHSIVLFGSRARGEAAPDSDMDLMVVVSRASLATRRAVRYLAVDVWLKHGIYLSNRVWSQEHWQKLATMRTHLYRNIEQDGIRL